MGLSFIRCLSTLLVALPCLAAAASAKSDAVGAQRTLVVLVNSSNRPLSVLPTRAEIHQAVFKSEFSLNAYYREVSQGQTQFYGSTLDWLQLPELNSECILPTEKLMAILSRKHRIENVDRFLVFYSLDEVLCEGSSLGNSTHGKQSFKTPNGWVRASVSNILVDHALSRPKLPFQRLSGLVSGVLVHEMGHGLGILGHSNILHCGSAVFSSVDGECAQSGIADMFAIMGGEGFFRPSVSMNACHREDLGWLKGKQIVKIKNEDLKGRAREFDIYPALSRRTAKPVAVRIDLEKPIMVTEKVAISSLFLEYKKAEGVDRRLADLRDQSVELYRNIRFSDDRKGLPNPKIDTTGIQIRGGFFRDGRCVTTYLFDTRPGSIGWDDVRYDLYDSLDGFLNPGMTVVEPRNGLSIEAVRENSDGSIRVRLAAD